MQERVSCYLASGDLVKSGCRLKISEKGWMISDAIMSDLFFV